jgi:hypothetical protein
MTASHLDNRTTRSSARPTTAAPAPPSSSTDLAIEADPVAVMDLPETPVIAPTVVDYLPLMKQLQHSRPTLTTALLRELPSNLYLHHSQLYSLPCHTRRIALTQGERIKDEGFLEQGLV